jgi:hypothetical protein
VDLGATLATHLARSAVVCAITGAGHAELMTTDSGYSMYEAAGLCPVTWPAMRAPLINKTSA